MNAYLQGGYVFYINGNEAYVRTAQHFTSTTQQAGGECGGKRWGGQEDWYLPSISEYYQMAESNPGMFNGIGYNNGFIATNEQYFVYNSNGNHSTTSTSEIQANMWNWWNTSSPLLNQLNPLFCIRKSTNNYCD